MTRLKVWKILFWIDCEILILSMFAFKMKRACQGSKGEAAGCLGRIINMKLYLKIDWFYCNDAKVIT